MPMRDKQKSFKDFLKAYSDFTFPSVRRPAPTMHEKAKFCIEYFKEGNVDHTKLTKTEK